MLGTDDYLLFLGRRHLGETGVDESRKGSPESIYVSGENANLRDASARLAAPCYINNDSNIGVVNSSDHPSVYNSERSQMKRAEKHAAIYRGMTLAS